jgi:hypothetical protein
MPRGTNMNPFPQMRAQLQKQEEEGEELLAYADVYLYALAQRILDWDPKVEEYWHSDGPCPFLTCLQTEPHDHPICPECRAVKWGNMFCKTCRSHWPVTLQPLRTILDAEEER